LHWLECTNLKVASGGVQRTPTRKPKGVWIGGQLSWPTPFPYLLLLLLSSLLLRSLFLSSHNCLLWLAMRSPTAEAPGYAGTQRHARSTAAGGAAAGRAFEARPVADHGEVAALRTSIAFEAFQPRADCRSARDADDGRLGEVRLGDGWAVGRSVGHGAGVGEGLFGDRDIAGRPAVQDVKIAAHVADAGDAAHRIGGLLGGIRAARRQAVRDQAAADAVGLQVALLDMGQVVAPQIGDGELAEDVVEHRRRHLDGVVAFDHAGGLEAREGIGLDEFLERHAVLQADRDRDREIVHDAAEGGAFLVHVDEDLADAAVLIFAGAQVDLVAANDRLLGVALAALRQALAALAHLALDDLLDDALGDDRRAGDRRHLQEIVVGRLVLADRHGRQRLRKLRAVAIERIGLQTKSPRHLVSLAAILDRSCV